MTYLFGAFLVLWAVIFGYIFSINARQKQVQQELQRMRERAESENGPTP